MIVSITNVIPTLACAAHHKRRRVQVGLVRAGRAPVTGPADEAVHPTGQVQVQSQKDGQVRDLGRPS